MTTLLHHFLHAVYYLLSAQWFHDGMKRMISSWKHTLLEYAHPLPSLTEIHVGGSKGVNALVMEEMMRCMQSVPNVVLVTESTEENVVQLEIDDDVLVEGLMITIRFLGRLSRRYPITPSSALFVDSNLDRLQQFLPTLYEWSCTEQLDKERVMARVSSELEWLETRFCEDSVWLEGFDSKTVADVCWTGVIRWIVENDLWEPDMTTSQYDNLACWWSCVRPEYIAVEDGDGDEHEDKKEENQKTVEDENTEDVVNDVK